VAKFSNISRAQKALLWISLLAVIGVVAAYLIAFWKTPVGGASEWGQFGDYFAGVLNPVIGLSTLFFVAWTLDATRKEGDRVVQEMKDQNKAFQKQLVDLERDRKLATLQKRLDGLLYEWGLAMNMSMPRVPVPSSDGSSRISDGQKSVREVLYDPGLSHRIHALKEKNPVAFREMSGHWAGSLEWCIQMFAEFEKYCLDHDSEAGEKVLADFYRHRIQLPLRTFNALGLVDKNSLENLRVGLPFLIGV
jgi:hypothetical protein